MYFFFSSRRRHTRSLCDWSSDVCSSDLDDQLKLVADFKRRYGVTVKFWRGSQAHILQRVLRSEEHTSELQSHSDLVCRLLLEKKNLKTSRIKDTAYIHTSSAVCYSVLTR